MLALTVCWPVFRALGKLEQKESGVLLVPHQGLSILGILLGRVGGVRVSGARRIRRRMRRRRTVRAFSCWQRARRSEHGLWGQPAWIPRVSWVPR